MGRTVGSKNTRNLTTLSRFDNYVENYGDPMELMFAAMSGQIKDLKGKLIKVETNARLQAAKELMNYGYAKKALIKHVGDTGDGAMVIQWQSELFDEDEDAAISDDSIPAESATVTIAQDSDAV